MLNLYYYNTLKFKEVVNQDSDYSYFPIYYLLSELSILLEKNTKSTHFPLYYL